MAVNTSSKRSRFSARGPRTIAALLLIPAAGLALLLASGRVDAQPDVQIGIKALGTVKAPMLLGEFRAGGEISRVAVIRAPSASRHGATVL